MRQRVRVAPPGVQIVAQYGCWSAIVALGGELFQVARMGSRAGAGRRRMRGQRGLPACLVKTD